jgi:phosphate transport system substrate-binding protein
MLARLAAVAALIALTAACGTAGRPGAQPGQADLAAARPTITETGSSLLYPLISSWASAYQHATPGVTVSTKSTSSGTGIAAASAGTTDLGASDAYLSSGDLVKNPSLRNIPLVVSAQTVIYNLPGVSQSDHVRLNGAVLAGIYDGTITRWDDSRISDINPQVNLPDLAIVPVHRSDSSGDTFLFTSYLSTQQPQWNDKIGYGTTVTWPRAAGAATQKGSLGVLGACKSTPGCVAYNGISYLGQAQSAGLGEAQLANAAGQYSLPGAATISAAVKSFVSITPPNETISMIDGPAAAGYPIVNYEYAVVSIRQPSAAAASQLRAFLHWVITTGNNPSYVTPVGFQPLPDDLKALGQLQIAEIGS